MIIKEESGVKKVMAFLMVITMVMTSIAGVTITAAVESNVIWSCGFENDTGTAVSYGNLTFTEGKVGKAAFFDGNSTYLQLPGNITSDLQDFTISAWVRFDNPATWQRVFDFGFNTTKYMFLGLSSVSNIRFAMTVNGNSNEEILNGTSLITSGKWNYFTVTQFGNIRTLYCNGVLVDSANVSLSTADLGLTPYNYIGKSQFNDPYFKGAIDEFKILNKASTQEEIVLSMINGLPADEQLTILEAYSNPGDLSAVKENLSLVTLDADGFSISWSSSNPDLLTADGIVARPEGNISETVILTATITAGNASKTVDYPVTIMARELADFILQIDGDKKGVDINPRMIGLFFEDINYGADGGLYAELVSNRSFEAVDGQSSKTNPPAIPGHSWSSVNGAIMTFRNESPLNENNTTYLRLTAQEGAGFKNTCYNGFPVKKGEKYDFSVYARGTYNGSIIASIVKDGIVCGTASIDSITGEWKKYKVEIPITTDAKNAILQVTLSEAGTVDFDMVSLFPQHTYKNRENGLRSDLVQKLKDLHPGFLRFPGGCIIEGYNLANRYQWKHTIGPVEERKENWNRWQVHTSGQNRYGYCQTYGLGFYEYFLLCEDIGAEPVPVVNCGMACQYQSGELASMEDVYHIYIQDALDLIEFANGDVHTEWGAKRAAMGHPEPFHLKYLGIGNEQWGEEFYKRYEAFQQVISEKYPEIRLVTSSGPSSDGTNFDNAWNWLAGKDKSFAYVVDEHYYKAPEWFYQNVNRYDDYDRNGFKVFAGEYASHASGTPNNLAVALSIAAYMTGFEKNADIVEMASYAPLFKREGYVQWSPDLIGFDENGVYGTPDYYVQSMYANNLGSYTVQNNVINLNKESTSSRGGVGVGTWATQAQFKDIVVTDNSTGEVLPLYAGNGQTSEGGLPSDTGVWQTLEDGTLSQTSSLEGAFKYFGKTDWSNYTITLKAMKTGGKEGFLIPFFVQDAKNYYMWNIAGWNNTVSAIEKATNGVKSTITRSIPLKVTTNVWYDIKIVVNEDVVYCYLNNELIHQKTVKMTEGPVYSTVSYHEETGDYIVKMVNSANSSQDIIITLNTEHEINPVADCILLTSASVNDQNSVSAPYKVSPKTYTVDGVSKQFHHVMPANSFVVMRIHTRPDNKIVQEVETVEYKVLRNGRVKLPETVTVTYRDGSTGALAPVWDIMPAEFTSKAGTHILEGKLSGTTHYAYCIVTILDEEATETEIIGSSISIKMENGMGTAEYTIEYKPGSIEKSLTTILVAYKDGKLVNVQYVPFMLPVDRSKVSVSRNMPVGEEEILKAMLWDGMKPLCQAESQ